ncbi:unnamed protein product [Tilletia caries]|nr:unnamed protein product [Tilletia caries]
MMVCATAYSSASSLCGVITVPVSDIRSPSVRRELEVPAQQSAAFPHPATLNSDDEHVTIAIIRHCLVHDAAEVRAAAAKAFGAECIGSRAIDETHSGPPEALNDSTSAGVETALAALRDVIANALAALVQVADPAMPKKLSRIITAFVKSLEDDKKSDVRPDVESAVQIIFASISDTDFLHQLMVLLLG